jgi:pimeloyl-ACP methyl ester carboxylesterase
MDLITVDGAELSSLVLGDVAAPAVAMLHGLLSGNMASWYPAIASPLAERRRVLLYDQRGHGSSTMPAAGFDLDSQAEDLLAVLAYYGLRAEPVDLVGHSMGALIALRFALRWPERVRRLVLVDAPMPAREYISPSLRGAVSREALAEYVKMHGLKGRRGERLHRRLAALFFESTLLRDVLAMDCEPDAALAALDVPVLLLFGDRSPCLEAGRHLLRMLPRARLQLLDGGHYLPEEAPAALRCQLDDFLTVAANGDALAGIAGHSPAVQASGAGITEPGTGTKNHTEPGIHP